MTAQKQMAPAGKRSSKATRARARTRAREARHWLQFCARNRLRPLALEMFARWLARDGKRGAALREQRFVRAQQELDFAPFGLRPLLQEVAHRTRASAPALPVAVQAALPQLAQDAVAEQALRWLTRLYPDAPPVRGFRAWLGRRSAHRRGYLQLEQLWDALLLTQFELLCAGMRPAPLPALRTLTLQDLQALAQRQAQLAYGVRQQGVCHNRVYQTLFGPERLRHFGLCDGSRVVLGGGIVEYELSAERRRLQMKHGEIYLEVENHLAWPFELAVGPHRFEVTRGQFGVQYGDGTQLELYGQLDEVWLCQGKQRLAFVPRGALDTRGCDQHVLISHDGRVRRTGWDPAAQRRRAQWREGVMNFEKTPLLEVVNTFNRLHSDLQLHVQHPHLYRRSITASLNLDDPVAFLGELLADPQLAKILQVGILTGEPPANTRGLVRPRVSESMAAA